LQADAASLFLGPFATSHKRVFLFGVARWRERCAAFAAGSTKAGDYDSL
jgi:hypothetical protein